MEINLLDIVVCALQDNPKVVTKLDKVYARDKSDFDIFAQQHKLDIKDISNRIKVVILQKQPNDILLAIGDYYTAIKNNVKKGLRFQETIGSNVKPTDIVKNFALYKFFELLLNKWQDFNFYENKILALAYHDINKTKLKDFEPPFQLTMEKDANKRSLISAFCGSSQLYAYVYGLLLHSGMSMAEVEKIKLTPKDYKDITYEIAEVLEANHYYIVSDTKKHLDFSLQNPEDNPEQVYVMILIGTMIKVFTKLYQQKQKELDSVKPEEKVIFKEDLESKKKLVDKQQALNKLQIDYDKQRAKLEALTEDFNRMKEYVEIIEIIQAIEENQKEDNPGGRPVIPYGKGIVLFGGHPNYQKKIAEKYNWVKIIDPDEIHVDWNLVKNANLILINWKHLPHRQFYSLISIIREYNKRYQYVW